MAENMKKIIRRLYGYLKRFVVENSLPIDIFYVISNIIFGDTKHQTYIRQVVGE